MGSNGRLEAGGGGVGYGGDLGSLWGSIWDQMGSLRIEEVVLGWGEIWGLYGVQFGIK